jgi:large subunit ribosomal protein L30
MAKIRITQLKSMIKRPKDQKDTLVALGLGKINRQVTKEATPQILGMALKISHLVKIEEVAE